MRKYLLIGGVAALAILATTVTVWACCGPYCQNPVINSVSVSPDMLWPPNHKMVGVTVSADVTFYYPTGAMVWICGVTSDEDENGLGDGDTAPDWEVTGDLTVDLRAERAGDGDGRTYTILVCAQEGPPCATSRSYEAVTVTVPHDKGK